MMAVNRNYARVIGGALEYAAAQLWIDGFLHLAPTAEEYAATGYYPVVPPDAPPPGKRVASRRWEIADGRCVAVDEYEELPPPVRSLNKYRLVRALQTRNLWPQVKAWLEATEGAYDLWLAAEDVSENEPLLAGAIEALSGVLSPADIEEILTEASA